MPNPSSGPVLGNAGGIVVPIQGTPTLSTAAGVAPQIQSIVTSTIPPSTGTMVASPVPPYVPHQPPPTYYEPG